MITESGVQAQLDAVVKALPHDANTAHIVHERLTDMLKSLCAGGRMACSGDKPTNSLDVRTEGELRRRLQVDQLADRLKPEELSSFTGLRSDQLKRLSVAPWKGGMPSEARELLQELQRDLPPGIAKGLLGAKLEDGLSAEMVAHIRRISTQQTAPGQGVDGSGDLPNLGAGPPPGGDIPVLPTPDVKPIPGQSGGQCQAPDDVAGRTPTAIDFAKKNRALMGASGTGSPYCRDGFSDVVLLDRAKPQPAAISEQVCSGVRIASNWILTAQHCVQYWTATTGRIFLLPAGAAKCLDDSTRGVRHPGDEACGLKLVKRAGTAEAAPTRSNGLKIDLALIPVEADASLADFRTASVTRFDASRPFEVTLAGFGESLGNPPGHFRVGWSHVLAPKALAAMTTGTDGDGNPLPSVPIEFKAADYGNDRLVSWSCGGDSGGPVFAGRVFGYAREPHNVAAIIVEGSLAKERCRADAPQTLGAVSDTDRVVSLLEPGVRDWLCSPNRRNALPICR
jgi:Trypsin